MEKIYRGFPVLLCLLILGLTFTPLFRGADRMAIKEAASVQSQPAPKIKFLTSPERAQAPFSEAVRVGNLLFLSGQLGRDPKTGKLAEGGIEAETRQCLENIKSTLEKYGSSLDKVVKATVMLADISEWAKMNSVYVTYFPKNKPARSAFGVSGLAGGARVEIEVIAYIE